MKSKSVKHRKTREGGQGRERGQNIVYDRQLTDVVGLKHLELIISQWS